jgi:hypothetical protein
MVECCRNKKCCHGNRKINDGKSRTMKKYLIMSPVQNLVKKGHDLVRDFPSFIFLFPWQHFLFRQHSRTVNIVTQRYNNHIFYLGSIAIVFVFLHWKKFNQLSIELALNNNHSLYCRNLILDISLHNSSFVRGMSLFGLVFLFSLYGNLRQI